MVAQVVILVLFAGMSGFSVWRAVRVWQGNLEYFNRSAVWTVVLPVRADFGRGLARGQAPLAAGVAALTAALALLDAAALRWSRGPASVQPAGRAPAWLGVVLASLLLVFLAGILLQLAVAWFNRPRWCVPRFLRDEPGAWQARRQARAGGARTRAEARAEADRAWAPRRGTTSARVLDRFDLAPGERILGRAMANEWRGDIAYGGRLVLTDQRLVFIPHAVNLDRDVWSSPAPDIAGCGAGERVNTIDVEFADGSRRSFVVFRRKRVLALIRRVAGL